MARKIVESFSVEEAFKELNKKIEKPGRKIRESAVSVIEVPLDRVGFDLGWFADEVIDGYFADDANAAVHKYYESATLDDLMIKKVFTTSDESEENYDVLDVFGVQLSNGDYLFIKELRYCTGYIKCKNYQSMCNYLLSGSDPLTETNSEIIEESVIATRKQEGYNQLNKSNRKIREK